MYVDTQQIKIKNGDLAIDAYLAMPQQQGIFPAIIVVQEIFGVNDHIRDVTRRIAQEGYIAISPAIYQRIAPGFETGYTPESVTIGREYKSKTKADELLSDIQATIDYLYTLPQVQKQGVGSVGFCFGGHVVYLISILNQIKATASFYGAGITTGTPGNGKPTISRTPDIKGTMYAFFGMQDASIPLEQVDQIEAELQKYHIPHQIFRYPQADHGFFCDQRVSYNAIAAQDAWYHVLELFKTTLKN
ncbi:carboxymethylenebutenolidase [Aphanothece hegewaldii CCALA 016]|uniref:Carboxymethylenebutenolidase n=1 Tax=Aphanothece hegewaldii CCALA 016 TaxID=2107694 RepID=A0A2T1LW97_9CHRO|nr:dienelactone hydrolase family protein [Aphanothece hegewaldii]PSF36182.1 carboxymethylenebutenolidase [Aphanothece hegewaldii CCALA 016]